MHKNLRFQTNATKPNKERIPDHSTELNIERNSGPLNEIQLESGRPLRIYQAQILLTQCRLTKVGNDHLSSIYQAWSPLKYI